MIRTFFYLFLIWSILAFSILFFGCEHYAEKTILIDTGNYDEKALSLEMSDNDLKTALQIVENILKEYNFAESEESGGYWIKLFYYPYEIQGSATNVTCTIFFGEKGELVISFKEWYASKSSEFVTEIHEMTYRKLVGAFGKDGVKKGEF